MVVWVGLIEEIPLHMNLSLSENEIQQFQYMSYGMLLKYFKV